MQKKKSHTMEVWLSRYSIIICGFGLSCGTRPLQGETPMYWCWLQ